jgi:hypothetical protein
MSQRSSAASWPPLVALVGWLVPGAGYWLLGQRWRALVVGITVLVLYLLGLLIGGIRVIDVPGYDEAGQKMMVQSERADGRVMLRRLPADHPHLAREARSALRTQPFSEIINKPWFIGQSLIGPVNLLAANLSLRAAQPVEPRSRLNPSPASRVPPSHARIYDIGTLYTAIAGMLSLLAIIDATARAANGEKK